MAKRKKCSAVLPEIEIVQDHNAPSNKPSRFDGIRK